MFTFTKWHFLFSSLVLLKITKAVTYCIYSIVIKLCDEIEFTLKSAENSVLSQNVHPRLKTNSTKNDGLNYTRPPVSYSVDRSIQPNTVGFLISNLPTGKKVTVKHVNRNEVLTNVSDVTYDQINSFRQRAVTVERTSSSVCLKPENTFPIKIQECSTPLVQHSRASQSIGIEPETNVIKLTPESKLSLPSAEQALNPQISNALERSSCLELDISNRVDKFELNKSNGSENKSFENVSLNVPQQIATYIHKLPSSTAVDLRERNVYPENKITQSNEKQSNESKSDDDEYYYTGICTAVRDVFQFLENLEKNDHSKEVNSQEIKHIGETNEEIERSYPNVNEHGGDCSRKTILDDELKVILSSPKDDVQVDVSSSILGDELKVKLSSPKDDVQVDDSSWILDDGFVGYQDHRMDDFTEGEIRCDIDGCSRNTTLDNELKAKLSSLKANVQVDDSSWILDDEFVGHQDNTMDDFTEGEIGYDTDECSTGNTTLNDELKVDSPHVDAQEGHCSWTKEDEFGKDLIHMMDDFTEGGIWYGVDQCNPRCIDIWNRLIEIGWLAYLEFLQESPPSLWEIEMEILKLCKMHYNKSVMTNEDVQVVHAKLRNLVQKSQDVNTKPYHGLVIMYAREINEELNSIQKHIECNKDLNTSNAVKRSFYLKQVRRVLTETRKTLFSANEDTIELQKQMQKTVKLSANDLKKRKRRR